MKGKTVVITGGNSGIGKEAAVGLAQRGANVVIAVRNQAKGAAAVAEAKSRSGNESVSMVPLDLASFASVRECAATLLESTDRIDVLMNNAGLVLRHRHETEDGHETVFQVNHLGHFLLTALLRERLIASAPARVVVTASHAHKYPAPGLDLDALEMRDRKYTPFRVYGRSKLLNILFTRELARTLDGTGVTANSLHPGYVASNFGREGDTGVLGNVGMILGRPFAISPARGAETPIYLASSPDVDGVTGQYFYKRALAQESRAASDDDAAAALWQLSSELTASA